MKTSRQSQERPARRAEHGSERQSLCSPCVTLCTGTEASSRHVKRGPASQGHLGGAQPAPWPSPACKHLRQVAPAQPAKTRYLCELSPELLLLSLSQTLASRSRGSRCGVDRDICHGVGQQTSVRRAQVDICWRQNEARHCP